MNTPDEKWQSLLRVSSSTFEGDNSPPFGFVTSTLAQLKSERQQQEAAERIGWRALLTSLAVLLVAAVTTFTIAQPDRATDFEPGVRSLVTIDHVQVS